MDKDSAAEALLSFWFGAEADDDAVARRQAPLWWSKDAELDRSLGERFEPELPGAGAAWPETPRGRLARVILLDQIPRSIYRGTVRAFAWDELARRQAEASLALGDESRLRPIQRVFLYMPFEHAEDLELQDLAVERFEALGAAVPAAQRQTFDGFLDFARRHRDIIRRFGRFPHRNAILGRPSTAEETAFLQTPGSSF